jgi:hypothetical protein
MRVAVLILAALASGCCGGTTHAVKPATTGRSPQPTLSAADGWMTRTVDPGGIAFAEASTVPPRESLDTFPDATLRNLPADGIVIYASGYQARESKPPFRALPLPYRLSEFRHDQGWEGQPAANVPQYVLATSLDNHLLDVRVFFGTQSPSGQQLAHAQAELDTLSWG